MKINPSSFSILVLLIFICIAGVSQEPLITQTRFANLSRNPALAGHQVDDIKLSICFHHQIKTVLIPYKYSQIQIESRFKEKESENGFTIGAIIRYDEAGEKKLKRAQFLPVLNFHKSLSDLKISYLSMGFMTGIFKTQFDPNSLPVIRNYNPIPFNPNSPVPQDLLSKSSSYIDFSTGISLYTELNQRIFLTLGAALFHFNQNTLKQFATIPKTPREWVINTGFRLNNYNYSFQLISDIRIQNNTAKFFCASILGIPIHRNFLDQVTEIQMGIDINSSREFSPSISVKLPDILFSCSYNLLLGKQKGIPILRNSIETNIAFHFNCHQRNKEAEKMHCYSH